MNKWKRICSIVAVVLILAMYVVTFFCAIFVKAWTMRMFLISVVVTMMLPVMLYILMWLYRVFGDRAKVEEPVNEHQKGFDEVNALQKSVESGESEEDSAQE